MPTLRKQASLVVGVPLLVIFLALLGIGWLVRETESSETLTQRAERLRFNTSELFQALLDAESGVRGYALTKDPSFLGAYHDEVRLIPGLIDSVRGGPSALAPAGRPRATAIAAAARVELGLLAKKIRDVDAGDGSALQIDLLAGKQNMDRIRTLAHELEDNVRMRLNQRVAEYEANKLRLGIAVGVAALLAAVAVFVTLGLFMSTVANRLAKVVARTARIAIGDDLLPPSRRPDEIGQLDRAVSEMGARLRRQSADLLRRNEQLLGVNKDLESFSYSVSHDLRSPVRAVLGYSRILEEDYGESLDDEGRRLLSVVQKEATRMGLLIDHLLELSRLGRGELQGAQINMEALVRDVVRELTEPCEPGTVEVEIGTLPDAYGDKTQLRQVWQNLISNAVKYSNREEHPVVWIGGTLEDGEAVYQVRDNGVGFDMQYADKLFGVFQRLHRNEDFPGTGVGLAIVHKVVSRHGGRVWAESSPGSGATFSFALPAALPAEAHR